MLKKAILGEIKVFIIGHGLLYLMYFNVPDGQPRDDGGPSKLSPVSEAFSMQAYKE